MELLYEFITILLIAIGVFFFTNYIGGMSLSRGYVSLNAGTVQDGHLLFNWFYKILAPILCCILVGAFLYLVNLEKYTKNLWLAVLICWGLRLVYNFIFQKFEVINKVEFSILLFISVFLSYLINTNLNEKPSLALPSWDNIISEIWLLLFFFVYQIFNNFDATNEKTIKRKNNYLKRKYLNFKELYGAVIYDLKPNIESEKLIYSILIYENFNRPFFVRKIENLLSAFRKNATYGVMQVTHEIPITDLYSVEIGSKKIIALYSKVEKTTLEKLNGVPDDWTPFAILRRVIWLYNNSDDYVAQVLEINSFLESTFYNPPKTVDKEMYFDANYSKYS